MNKPLLSAETAAQELWKERFSDAKVVFLAGSVIRGEATAHSDLDLVIVYDKLPTAYRDSFIYRGWPVEVFVHDPETLNYFFLELDRPSGVPSLPSMVMEGIEIPVSSDFSRSLKAIAKSVLDGGPPIWTAGDLQRARYMVTDCCDDMRSPRSTEELVASATKLYEGLADFYCRSQGLWSAKGKSIPRRLLQIDSTLARTFTEAFENVFERHDATQVIALAEDILRPHGGFLFENALAEAPITWRKPIAPGLLPTSRYQEAENLLRSEDSNSINEALSLLKQETDQRPNDAKAWFELAGAYDFLGREVEALPFYQRAIDIGFDKLPPEDQPRLFVQMGSTLRNLKKYEDSKKLLLDGIQNFPHVSALKTFLGLSEYSDGAYRKAAKNFLQASLYEPNDHSLKDYQRALMNYSEQIDTFPARQRNWMRFYLADTRDPIGEHNTTRVSIEHAKALAELMDTSYTGTIDHEGETLDQCFQEMKGTIEGKYGPFISEASFVSFDGLTAASASLITLWKGSPLLAFSMTAPNYQGRGLARFLIQKSLHALKTVGYRELYLVVTEGNTPAEKLYRKVGFEFLGPAIPGRAAKEQG